MERTARMPLVPSNFSRYLSFAPTSRKEREIWGTPYSFARRGPLAAVYDAAFHDKGDAFEDLNVVQRIAGDGDDVRVEARL